MTHLSPVPVGVCEGRDKYTVELADERARMRREGLSGLVVTIEKIADHSGNVDCLRCKTWLKANRIRREKMHYGN